MVEVIPETPPAGSLIAPFGALDGHYADAFHALGPAGIGLPDFISAFYRTAPFRAERLVLRLAGHPGTDADLDRLAEDRADRFAAWAVEGRRTSEILLGDLSGRTKSWLMVEPRPAATRLWFGSVVVPAASGEAGIGRLATALIGPHRLYSRLLLRAAAKALASGG
jgi:hypothetical protein